MLKLGRLWVVCCAGYCTWCLCWCCVFFLQPPNSNLLHRLTCATHSNHNTHQLHTACTSQHYTPPTNPPISTHLYYHKIPDPFLCPKTVLFFTALFCYRRFGLRVSSSVDFRRSNTFNFLIKIITVKKQIEAFAKLLPV